MPATTNRAPRLGLAVVLVATASLGTGCLDDVRDSTGGVTDTIANRIDAVVRSASGPVGDALGTVGDHAGCLADGASGVFGEERLEEYQGAGGDLDARELVSMSGTDTVELSEAVDECLDFGRLLVAVLTSAGLAEADASCVAGFVLDTDRLKEPILLQLLLGDPGVLTAIGLAARGADACDLGPDVELDLPGL